MAAIGYERSNRHMDMVYAKCRDTTPPGMYISPIRWDISHFQIRIEILASEI